MGLAGWGGARAGVEEGWGVLHAGFVRSGQPSRWRRPQMWQKCAMALNHKRLLAEGGGTFGGKSRTPRNLFSDTT